MNIVAINGSPNGPQGATGRLLAALAVAAKKAGAEVHIFELGLLTVKPCTACRTCQRTGACPIPDDYQHIKSAMLAADGIVLGSPNYISSVSAQMKALLDRSFSMFHCQMLHGKYGACVVASGGPMYDKPLDYLMQVIGNAGCWKVGGVGSGSMVQDDPEQAAEADRRARDLGRQLAEAIKNRQPFPEQEQEREQAFEIMRWLVEQQKDDWPFEYTYWQKHWCSQGSGPGGKG